MWTYNEIRAYAPELTENAANRTTWREAWLMIREAVRPYPEAAQAVLAVVDRLIAECDAARD